MVPLRHEEHRSISDPTGLRPGNRQIAKVDQRIRIVDVRGWFDIELRASWPQWTVDRYLGSREYPVSTVEERNRALASAEVALLGWPPLKDLRSSRTAIEVGS